MLDVSEDQNSFQLLRRLATHLGYYEYDGGEIKVHKNDREFLIFIYISVHGGGKANLVGTPSFFEIKTIIPFSHPSFGIRKPTKLDWITEHILFMHNYRTGDHDFDEKFIIKLEDKGWGNHFFEKCKVKSSISDLLSYDFDLIHTEDGYLKVVKYVNPGECPTDETVINAIGHIQVMLSNFPTSSQRDR